MCCYQHQKYFDQALKSICIQKPKIKIIVLNNGADKKYSRRLKKSLKLVQYKNISYFHIKKNSYGLALREKVLPRIKTKYLAILHDDDVYEKYKIARSLSAIQKNNYDFIVTNHNFIDEKNNIWRGDNPAVNTSPMAETISKGELLADFLRPPGCRLHFSTLLIKTQLAKETLLGNPFYPRIADCFFWAELLLKKGIRFKIIKEELTNVRIHNANDRNYKKFTPKDRILQFVLLGFAETKLFEYIINNADDRIIKSFIKNLIENKIRTTGNLNKIIIDAAIYFNKQYKDSFFSKNSFVFTLINYVFNKDRAFAISYIRKKHRLCLNKLMQDSYEKYAKNIFSICDPVSLQNFKDATSLIYSGLKWIYRHPRLTINTLLKNYKIIKKSDGI